MKRFVRQQLTNTLVIGRCIGADAVSLSTLKALLHEQVDREREGKRDMGGMDRGRGGGVGRVAGVVGGWGG